MRKANYDKYPSTKVTGSIAVGWKDIIGTLQKAHSADAVWVVDLYVGTYEDDIIRAFSFSGRTILDTRSLMVGEEKVNSMTKGFMTDDVLFGYMSNLTIADYFDKVKVEEAKNRLSDGQYIIIGTGASLIAPAESPVVYADMARWEIQQRFRRHEVKALGIDNSAESPSLQYKRGYFNDWNVCDTHKENLLQEGRIAYWLDTNDRSQPKMITHSAFMQGIEKTVRRPFRVVPFFDPAPWGGQWMKEVCDLDRDTPNFGWCFDCVPEENSLYFDVNGVRFELPSKDLVIIQSLALLGEQVEARFGKEFPIRFDFLDTMGGGNLSLQVHPTNDFSHRNFGIHYTQDESYYLVDAGENSVVYLGLKEGVDRDAMISDLRKAQRGELVFDAEKYVNKIPAKKHDHFLIPAGTIHCSGSESMVLEISSTPNLFTFKLWDWQRLGLDGKPRPINVERGRHVINWSRDTKYVYEHLYNKITVISDEEGVREEKTGLHPNEFIETRRHIFSKPVKHNTGGGVNVLNLVDGDEAIIESPTGAFEPFVVHYAETFIIPACVGEYTIRPYGLSEGKECVTIKAYVR
jgi:mannose-6-phosphate isomerase class I